MTTMIKIEQIGAPIRRPSRQRETLIGLGLNRIGRVVYVPDTPQTRGMIDKVKHLIRVHTNVAVTFDSNSYRQAVDPHRARRDASPGDLRTINLGIKDGSVRGYLSETVATLEGIQRAQRGSYFAQVRPSIRSTAEELPNGMIKVHLTLEPKDTLHPGLHAIVADWIAAAMSLNFKFLYAPRLGVPRPSELLAEANFAIEPLDEARILRQQYFAEVGREIEARGVGIAQIKAVGERIKARTKSSEPWYMALNDAKDDQEHKEIQNAVSEWADGDTVAAHIAYGNDVLCSADKRKSASIFDATNRTWLDQNYGVRILTLRELASELRMLNGTKRGNMTAPIS